MSIERRPQRRKTPKRSRKAYQAQAILSVAREAARARAIAAARTEQAILKDEYLERQRAREQARESAPSVPRPPMLR